MNVIGTFAGLGGFYVLTPDGQLGSYDPQNKFVPDAKLTKAFVDYNRQYLMAYLRNPAQGNFRLGILYLAPQNRSGGPRTLLLERPAVRRLYPVTGMTSESDLTAFQKRNREQELYRGMELFLEYKDKSNPEAPFFCPVLFDRSKILRDYTAVLDRPVSAEDRETPVAEVLNLIAPLPVAQRLAPEIATLREKIYQCVTQKGARTSATFTLIEDIRQNTENCIQPESGSDPYGPVDKRAARPVTLDQMAGDGRTTTLPFSHPRQADSTMLKTFTRFHDLDHDTLETLASCCLVYERPPGTRLLERGTSDTLNLYLLEGTVQLIAADGRENFIEGGADAARNPISNLKPRLYAAIARTRVAFMWIDDKLVEAIMRDKAAPRRCDNAA